LVFHYLTIDRAIACLTIDYAIDALWVYAADLIGGGTANIREYGSSGLWPTIDTLNHYTISPNGFVKEVKFKY